jgi:hypothetical protein
MKTKAEVIAMLMPEGEDSDRMQPMATLLVRNPDGRMSLETVSPDSTLGVYAMSSVCFRQGTPIIDPVTRQVLGYEMEMIESPLARLA